MSIFTVSQLNHYIALKLKMDAKLQGIFVRGEIADFMCHPRSGHCYFTLRDGETAMRAVMFARQAAQLRFMPENGMTVLASASLTVYERDGVYQLMVNDLQPDGVGAAHVALEQRKKKLAQKGYFDEAHKRPIPAMPKKIAVVTAPGGAALQDILHILSRRYPLGTVVLFAALVQGTDAPASIAGAIARAGQSDCDVLIVGRGGGSDEDLSAFNAEIVADAIYNCPIPVISAVGHETDVSLADFTADLRASTPSAAAELAAPERGSLELHLRRVTAAMQSAYLRRLDSCEATLRRKTEALRERSVAGRLAHMSGRAEQLRVRLRAAMDAQLSRCQTQLAHQAGRLDCLSPLKVMARGYSLVYRGETLLSSAAGLQTGDTLRVRFADGECLAQVTECTERSREDSPAETI